MSNAIYNSSGGVKELTSSTLSPKTQTGGINIDPTLVDGNNLVDVILLDDGEAVRNGKVTYTGAPLNINTYYYASSVAPYYTEIVPVTGFKQQLFFVDKDGIVHIDIGLGYSFPNQLTTPFSVTEKFNMTHADANGTLLGTGILIDGLRFHVRKVTNALYAPRITNETGADITLSSSSGNYGVTAENQYDTNVLVVDTGNFEPENNNAVYWDTRTEVVMNTIIVNHTNYYYAKWMAYELGTEFQIFITVSKLL